MTTENVDLTAIKSKKQLENKFSYIPTIDFRKSINEIISRLRKIDPEIAKFKKNLRPNEVMTFAKENGCLID